MNVNISLCESNNDEFEMNLSKDSFFQLWRDYLQLPNDRNVFSSKEIIDSIDKNLEPDYSTTTSDIGLLDNIKKLENICVMGLINKDSICLRVEK